MKPIWKFIDYNRGLVTSVVLTLIVGGCAFFPPKAPLPSDASKFGNEFQIEADKAAYLARYEASKAMIDAQKTFLRAFADTVVNAAGNIGAPWSGILQTGLGLITTGLGVDNIRKRGVIKTLKAKKK